ncbi:hypothetical protein L596_017328 [Steinernema carpocapsae]|uniref:MARVEL domain-containing protein n=1 Tax=Steinernema carpocapsae TaxID=34508 RepID=A0A4U5N1B8_STECR|nr:hypothetical protein L596_017328 [Steinernema carpocapsae]
MGHPELLICGIIKILVVLLTIAVLILLDPDYVTAYISVNYEIVFIYIVSALTLLYCVVSIVMYALMFRRSSDKDDEEPERITNCSLSEIVLATAGIMGWVIVCGIGGNVSQRTIIETGERFGWLAACAGINTAMFLGIAIVFCLYVVNTKIVQRDRKGEYTYGNRM